MPVRKSNAEWKGNLRDGSGRMAFGGGAYEGAYSFRSRFEEGTGTNPEELIAAAHAGCFSMALSNILDQAGYPPKRVQTTAKVHLDKGESGFSITRIELDTEAEVPGIDEDTFRQQVDNAKQNCPVSRALKAVEISANGKLVG